MLRRILLVAVIILTVALAGCMAPLMGPSNDSEESSEVPPTGSEDRHESPGRLLQWDRPLIVNGTRQDHHFDVRMARHDRASDCSFQQSGTKGSYLVFNKHRPLASGYYELGPDDREQRIRIQVSGEPPFMFIGDWSACIDSDRTRAYNLTSSYQVLEGDKTHDVVQITKNVTVPAGEESTETTWTPSPLTFRLLLARPDHDNRTGASYGSISIWDDRGTRICRDTYTPMGHEVDCVPFYFYPGPYTIRLNLTRPAARETTWPYIISYTEFHAGICDHGFTWEGLCT